MNIVDRIIHYMRQSKMDSVRKGLEDLVKDSKSKNKSISDGAKDALMEIELLFKEASNNAPLP
jgi:hypothetical protein